MAYLRGLCGFLIPPDLLSPDLQLNHTPPQYLENTIPLLSYECKKRISWSKANNKAPIYQELTRPLARRSSLSSTGFYRTLMGEL